jgi:phosphohistidine phosphatase SixA
MRTSMRGFLMADTAYYYPEDRSISESIRVGKRLAKLGWLPDVVVGSDSRRTEETWERKQNRFPDARVRFTRALYASGPGELRSEVARVSADVRTVLVLGHNPGWEEAVTELSVSTKLLRARSTPNLGRRVRTSTLGHGGPVRFVPRIKLPI